MNLSPEEFYDYLPKHFWTKMDGFYELENLRQQQEWERVRWQTTYLINVHLPKNKSIKSTDLVKFDWEKKEKIDVKKLKERAEYYKKMNEYGK